MTSCSSIDPLLQAGNFVPRGPDVDQAIRKLTFQNIRYLKAKTLGLQAGKKIPETVRAYRNVPGGILVPRHFRGVRAEKGAPYVKQGLPLGQSIIKWRDEIQEAASAALLKDSGDKLLCLSCGKGKTCVSLGSAAIGDRAPVIVIVHTFALLNQWLAEARTHLQLRDDEIGCIHGPHKGLRARCDWQNKKLVVALIHSIVHKTEDGSLGSDFRGNWRLAIFDECHVLGAAWMSRAIWQFPCERWGLTATADRDDGFNDLFRHHFGRVCYSNLEQEVVPRVYFAHTRYSESHTGSIPYYRGNISLPVLLTRLGEIEERNEQIIQMLQRAASKGRKLLVVGERVKQLVDLFQLMPSDSKGLFVSKLKADLKQEALKKDVIFATTGMVKEGVNKPDWDSLFLLSPFGGKGRLAQTGGRICRVYNGKKTPVIVVLVDDFGICKALARMMERNAVEQMDWDCKTILFDRLI